jgi:chorismate-pyruvate lyase
MFGMIDMGGFSENDIKIFGRHRLSGMYEFVKAFEVGKKNLYQRIRLKQQFEVIIGAHSHVNPLRMETSATYYPIQGAKSLGFVVSYIYGHDNYNYRMVDAGHQATVGISWDFFPPVKLSQL